MANQVGKEGSRKGARRVLIAAHPHAAQVVQAMMRDMANLISAHTSADAFRILEHQQILRDSLVGSMRDACKACGAVDFVDVARMPPDLAEATMRKAVETYLQ